MTEIDDVEAIAVFFVHLFAIFDPTRLTDADGATLTETTVGDVIEAQFPEATDAGWRLFQLWIKDETARRKLRVN